MKSSMNTTVAVRLMVALKRYFPAGMLMCMSIGTICATAYSFKWLNPFFALFCILVAFLALFSGLLLAHNLYAESGGQTLPMMESGDMANPLGLFDGNFSLASLSSVMHEGVVLLKAGRILYANPAFAYILAAHESELAGSRLTSYIHPDDLTILRLDEKTQAQNVIPSRSTLRLTTRLGDVRWVICSVYNTTWQKEEVSLLIFEDIGALKQAQSSLDEYEQQSRILLERTPLGIAMFDAMGVLKLSNTAWRTTWSNVVGTGGRRFNILQDPFMPGSNVERAMRQAFAKQESGISNYEHNTPWGETRWLNLNFHPMLTPLDQLIGVAMIQQDITDYVRSARRENELNDQLTALRIDMSHASAQYAQVIDQSPNVIICFDGEGSITAWNSAAERRFGLPRKRVLGLEYKRLGADLQPYLPYLRKKQTASGINGGFSVERTDAAGLHYERVFVNVMRLGMKNTTVLEIRDVSSFVFASQMRNFLSGMTTAAAMGGLLAEILDFSVTPPALKSGQAMENIALLSTFAGDFGQVESQISEVKPVKMSDILQELENGIQTKMPGAAFLLDYAQPDLELESDAPKLGSALSDLAVRLGAMIKDGDNAEFCIFQRVEADYAILNVFCKNIDAGSTPLQALWVSGNNYETCDIAFNGMDWLREYPGSPLRAVRDVAGLRGIIGVYIEPQGGAGIVCRLPLGRSGKQQA